MSGDAGEPTRGHGDHVRLLERAMAVEKRRRRYRLGVALIALAVLTTFVVLGVMLLLSG
jgi:hypothetical protein